jgi:ATP-binding cassette subfamily B protein
MPGFEVCVGLLTAVSILAGGWFVLNGSISIGDLVVVNALLWTLVNPVRMLPWLMNDVQRADASVEKIQEILYAQPRIFTKKRIPFAARAEGRVEFRSVSFRYESLDALYDISFNAEKGETVAIIGATGAGKSSLVQLICRFYDASVGTVLVDGMDVRDWNVRKLRGAIAMTMQDIFLFSDTIEGNIAYGAPDIDFEQVARVAETADADGFIRRMPDGYDTIVGERGVGLSGGQKQRIALARALLKEPSILILDDATSSVDMETEHSIHQTLRTYFKDRTTFIIAHRISTVKDADKILVLDGGRIAEMGTHGELLAKGGYYADVYENQLGDFNLKRKG